MEIEEGHFRILLPQESKTLLLVLPTTCASS